MTLRNNQSAEVPETVFVIRRSVALNVWIHSSHWGSLGKRPLHVCEVHRPLISPLGRKRPPLIILLPCSPLKSKSALWEENHGIAWGGDSNEKRQDYDSAKFRYSSVKRILENTYALKPCWVEFWYVCKVCSFDSDLHVTCTVRNGWKDTIVQVLVQVHN